MRKRLFEHAFLDIPKLERISMHDKRYYVLPDETLALSVTTVIGDASDKTGLMEWRKRVGEAEANRISTQAARRGTALHSICEHYLLNEEGYPNNTMPSNMETFKILRPYLDDHVGRVYGIESTLYSTDLQAAGTTDCIADWDGVPSIIDFKTSRRIKEEGWIENYFLQATTYSLMVEEITKLRVPQIVILIAVDDSEPQLFVKDRDQYVDRVKEIFYARKSSYVPPKRAQEEARAH